MPEGLVMVAGGWTFDGATADAELYDPIINIWIDVASMPNAHTGAVSVPLPDGTLLIAWGVGVSGTIDCPRRRRGAQP